MIKFFVLMESKKYTPPLLKYNLEDLYEAYVEVFFSRNLFGPKGKSHPLIDSSEDFVIRARYLLSVISEEHIEVLFQASDPLYNMPYFFAPTESFQAVAAWVAGLLKSRYFLPQITRLIKTGGNFYYAHAWFASLLLFDDASLSRHYVDFLLSGKDSDQSLRNHATAIFCLTLWDQK